MLPYVLYYDQHTSLQPTDSQLRYMYKFTYHLLPSSSNGLHNLLDPRLFIMIFVILVTLTRTS